LCFSPLFVTWNLVSSAGVRRLRGCIGTFEPLPLAQGLKSYALTAYLPSPASTHSSHFGTLWLTHSVHLMIPASTRLFARKFPDWSAGNTTQPHPQTFPPPAVAHPCACSVSLLIDFETCDDPLDWLPGTHGIRIAFPHPQSRRRLSATYLPDVCTDQGWTKEECLESLMRKAGYDPSFQHRLLGGGGKNNSGWQSVHGLKVERYRALKGRISYDGYVEAVADLGKLN